MTTAGRSAEGGTIVPWLSSDEQTAWRSFLTGATLLFDHLDHDLRESSGLSLPEYEILVRLSESPERRLRMAELADSVSHSRSRVTHTIARLERTGLVDRRACASDGRGVNAHLTERGWQRLVEAAPRHVSRVRAALVDQISPADLEAVGRVFRAVSDAVTAGSGEEHRVAG
jgi:DNA-binding MarR family transcriptional regulator